MQANTKSLFGSLRLHVKLHVSPVSASQTGRKSLHAAAWVLCFACLRTTSVIAPNHLLTFHLQVAISKGSQVVEQTLKDQRKGYNRNVCVEGAIRLNQSSLQSRLPLVGTQAARSPSMPTQPASSMPVAFPSFMSVFGTGSSHVHDDITKAPDEAIVKLKPYEAVTTTNLGYGRVHYPLPTSYQHRDSAASISSDSTDSSPTTTTSTFDSPLISDASPSSSPESPTSALPLSPFKSMMVSQPVKQEPALHMFAPPSQPSEEPAAELSSSNTRNVKNLSLIMDTLPLARPASATGAESVQPFSTPASPLRTLSKTRRRMPTNLSIQTPGLEKATFATATSEIPSTPSHWPILQHYPSSPAFPSLVSPLAAPNGGMQLPTPSFARMSGRPCSQQSFSNQSISSHGLQDVQEEANHYDPPKSQEKQERGYPNGPIKVYDSGVYLYLEPNQEEAARFDTVINVAKEIKNPFTTSQNKDYASVMSVWRNDNEKEQIPEPQTAVSEKSFTSAFEWPQSATNTSSIPQAEGLLKQNNLPEYIHVPWDHNSELIDDLYPLCCIIDSRIAEGKSVLIHCQLGVSRSASLVLAYGLYKGYQPDFHTMYGTVKERSQWISPNMSLIYQLMDFRSRMTKGHFLANAKPAKPEWFLMPRQSTTTAPLATLSTTGTACGLTAQAEVSQEHQILAISPPEKKPKKVLPPVPLFPKDENRKSVPFGGDGTSDTLSSAGSTRTVFAVPSAEEVAKTTKRAAPRQLPFRIRAGPQEGTFDIPPFAQNRVKTTMVVREIPTQMDLALKDAPATPSLFSPRQAEFMATSITKTVAGDLATRLRPTPSEKEFKATSTDSLPAVDPRSPHQRHEAGEILRSIDETM